MFKHICFWVRKKLTCRHSIKLKGHSFRTPSILSQRVELTEPWMVDLLSALLPRTDGCFLDIGVNLGQTLIKVKAVELERKYVGLEPNPTCVAYVKELIRVNGLVGCTLVPGALSNTQGLAVLNCICDTDGDSAASIIDGQRDPGRIVRRIPCVMFNYEDNAKTLDSLIGKVGVIKIDVEGAEVEVIETLVPVIRRDLPIITVEILPVYSAENIRRIERQTRLQGILRSCGYTLYRIVGKNTATLKLVQINDIEVHSDLELCDYVALPADKIGIAAIL